MLLQQATARKDAVVRILVAGRLLTMAACQSGGYAAGGVPGSLVGGVAGC
jgi:hypothetical protein